MRVHVLASRNIISFYFFYPLWLFSRELRETGVEVFFHRRLNALPREGECLVIDNRFFSPWWRERRQDVLDVLSEWRSRFSVIIWADVTDSTGATQFQVLPFVDRYWKKQVLKDRTAYTQSFYGARVYTDYYHREFHLPEEEVFRCEPAQSEDLEKIEVSWNLGLGPCFLPLQTARCLNIFPHPLWARAWFPRSFPVSDPDRPRPLTVVFRGTGRYGNAALSFQRQEVIQRLARRGVATNGVSRRRYMNELRQARVAVSPFGAGEICFRDFEIFLAGAALFKPDMSHLETWPDFFEAGKTYQPFRWDFSDFDTALEMLLRDESYRRQLATAGKARYTGCFSVEGRRHFCQRFQGLLNSAVVTT